MSTLVSALVHVIDYDFNEDNFVHTPLSGELRLVVLSLVRHSWENEGINIYSLRLNL